MSSIVYLDYLATTPIDPQVLDYYTNLLKTIFANPSSVDHDLGTEANKIWQKSKEEIAKLLECLPQEIIFTSGATESISLFLQGYALSYYEKNQRPIKILSSPVEHVAVLQNLENLQNKNLASVQFLSVNRQGQIYLEEIQQYLKQGMDLVCVMAVNNETGNIYPIAEIAQLCLSGNAHYFCDATQAMGKIPISMSHLPNTTIAFSGHKIYAPKGIGALILPEDISIKPLFFGGEQQKRLRPGTMNPPLAKTLAYALKLCLENRETEKIWFLKLRNLFLAHLNSIYPNYSLNQDPKDFLPQVIPVSLLGINNKELISYIRHKVAISTGAACSSGSERPSHVLKAMGLSNLELQGALRISLGRFTTETDIQEFFTILEKALIKQRDLAFLI